MTSDRRNIDATGQIFELLYCTPCAVAPWLPCTEVAWITDGWIMDERNLYRRLVNCIPVWLRQQARTLISPCILFCQDIPYIYFFLFPLLIFILNIPKLVTSSTKGVASHFLWLCRVNQLIFFPVSCMLNGDQSQQAYLATCLFLGITSSYAWLYVLLFLLLLLILIAI